MRQNQLALKKGLHDGIPIALGYFAVSFSLGIMAKKVGLNPVQGFVSSILNHASAGEYAEFTVIAANASYLEMALVIFITNARYLLMSCAMSQKFNPDTSLFHRALTGFCITDEIFGISIATEGNLNPFYTYGAFILAGFFWASGTAIGIIAGSILPSSIVSALSVALYGMFLAIIIPPARENKVILGLILLSFACSFCASRISWFVQLSASMRTIILTVLLSGLAAIFFPVKEDETKEDETNGS